MTATNTADSECITAIYGCIRFPDLQRKASREVVLFTKTANGKAIGQPQRIHHPITKDLSAQTWHEKGFGRFAVILQR